MRLSITTATVLSTILAPASGQQICQTNKLATSPPSSALTPVQLQSYSYCGGKLIAVQKAYVNNLNYNKLINLRYSNALNQTNALTVVPLSYWGLVGSSNWEYWGTLAPVAIDGINSLVNLSYTAVDLNKTYTQPLNILVRASGPPAPSLSAPPVPVVTPKGFSQDITNFLSTVQGTAAGSAFKYMFRNINPNINGTISGAVVAAQSGPDFPQTVPNYQFDWVRDSALTMNVVSTLYSAATKKKIRQSYESLLFSYATSRATQQNYPVTGLATTGLGEPKYYLNQTVFAGSWARPQNDGPASSAIALMESAIEYLANGGNASTISQHIWDSTTFPATAPVQKDLLYTAASWSAATYDLWEETSGSQFYTRMVQRRALIMGATLASRLGDDTTAVALNAALTALNPTLAQFWDPARQAIVYEYGPVLMNKLSYLDTAVVLGILHGYAGDGVYSCTNDQILSTALRIATAFSSLYAINNVTTDAAGRPLGIAVGRYPEDVYNGTGSSSGNPWYVTTAAMAEYMYKVSNEYNSLGQISVTNTSKPFFDFFAPTSRLSIGQTYVHTSKQYRQAINGINGCGDAFMRTIKTYMPSDGQLSEQFNRNTGVSQGAQSLAWSYAALLSAAFARAELQEETLYVTELANQGYLMNDVDGASDGVL